VQVRLTFVK